MDVNFRHKPRVTTCNFRYTRQCAAIPHRSVYTFPPPSYFPFSLFLPSSTVAVSSFLPLARLPVCLRARRFHSLVVATGVLRSHTLPIHLDYYTDDGRRRDFIKARCNERARWPAFIISYTLSFFSRSVVNCQEQQVRLGGSVGGLFGLWSFHGSPRWTAVRVTICPTSDILHFFIRISDKRIICRVQCFPFIFLFIFFIFLASFALV